MKNKISVDKINQLSGALQDMWHYAALIKPHPEKTSTFLGNRHYMGLQGKLRAYESLSYNIILWQVEELEDFMNLNLPEIENIDSEKELIEQTGYAINAINLVCQANNIDGYSGKINS